MSTFYGRKSNASRVLLGMLAANMIETKWQTDIVRTMTALHITKKIVGESASIVKKEVTSWSLS